MSIKQWVEDLKKQKVQEAQYPELPEITVKNCLSCKRFTVETSLCSFVSKALGIDRKIPNPGAYDCYKYQALENGVKTYDPQ